MSNQLSKRGRFGYPVIDSDGHTIEFVPALFDILEKVAGRKIVEQYRASFEQGMYGWYDLTQAERAHQRYVRPPWWAGTQHTVDRATATLPSLLYERMEELGLDFAVLYPSVTLLAPDYPDEELRRAACRAANLYHAEFYGEFKDRMAPVAVIPMHTPEEAIAELDFAIGELGLKAVMMAGSIRRPVPVAADISAEAAQYTYWIDTLGVDSAHDYDPVWQRCVELGVSPTFHSSAMTWGNRASVSNYVYNHIGAFGTANEGTARSLFLGGVTRRFPALRFGFLEGGVGWACSLYSDLVGHWEKRGHRNIRQYDPQSIDEGQLLELFKSHGSKLFREGRDRLIGEIGLHSTPEDMDHLDEFEACEIKSAADIKELFADRFYFGCEADDPINAWAFNDKLNPLGARLRAMFSSDIGHWDVPDMSRVTDEAYELVECGHLDEDSFRDFMFTYPAEFWTAANPAFFEGTAVESEVAKLSAERS